MQINELFKLYLVIQICAQLSIHFAILIIYFKFGWSSLKEYIYIQLIVQMAIPFALFIVLIVVPFSIKIIG